MNEVSPNTHPSMSVVRDCRRFGTAAMQAGYSPAIEQPVPEPTQQLPEVNTATPPAASN